MFMHFRPQAKPIQRVKQEQTSQQTTAETTRTENFPPVSKNPSAGIRLPSSVPAQPAIRFEEQLHIQPIAQNYQAGSRQPGWRPTPSPPARAPSIENTAPRPEPAQVVVLAPSHGNIHATCLGRFYRASKVSVHNANGAVTANNCKLAAEDHYHVSRVSLSPEGLLDMSKAAKKALIAVIRKPTGAKVRAFQRRLAASLGSLPERRVTVHSGPVANSRLTYVTDSTVVQQTDGSTTTLETRYRIRETRLPIADLLREDGRLVLSLARALRTGTGAGLATFLRDSVKAAGNIEAMSLLDYASSLNCDPTTSIFSLFGRTDITNANAVMIGAGNTWSSRSKVWRPRAKSSELSAIFDGLATVVGPNPLQVEATPEPRIQAKRSTTTTAVRTRSERYDSTSRVLSQPGLPTPTRELDKKRKLPDVEDLSDFLGSKPSTPDRNDNDDFGSISPW